MEFNFYLNVYCIFLNIYLKKSNVTNSFNLFMADYFACVLLNIKY